MNKAIFIREIAGHIQKIAPEYDIRVNSPVIAQAILESAFGESKLSAVYHNYFGLKCGTKWAGRSVNMKTQEEYTPGTKTTIRDNFRAYGSMEEGVRGYFEFIQMERYRNLKGITDPQKYLETIIRDGYATSSTYVRNCMSLIREYDLTRYDTGKPAAVAEDKKRTASDYLAIWHSWLGWSESNGRYKQIIDILNVRSWAGTEHPNIKSIPYLKYGTTVDICDTVKAADGSDWYYVLIDGRIYGFVSAKFIREV